MKKRNRIFLLLVLSVALVLLVGCKQNVTDKPLTIEVDGAKISGQYTGSMENGVPIETGTFTSDDEKFIYEGTWENGVPSGSGHLYYDGYIIHFSEFDRVGVYDGEVVDGIPKGTGTFSAQTDDGVNYTYTGEWDNGTWNGKGEQKYDNDDYFTKTGTFVNGDFEPTALEFVKSFGNHEVSSQLPYEVSELAESFIEQHSNLFPVKNFDDISKYIDYSIGYKEIAKSPNKYGDKMISIENAHVVSIDEEQANDSNTKKLSYLILVDESDNVFYVIYWGVLNDIYQGDYVNCYGVPVAFSQYENTGGGTTKCPVVLGSYVEKLY